LAAIFKHQLNEISYIIPRHFQNVFIYQNWLENAKTIGQKRKCNIWHHFGLAAILNRPRKEILYIILKLFQNIFSFKIGSKLQKL
jgi:hypothetical protein